MTQFQELARRYGTPLYVYDLDRLATTVAELRSALPDGVRILYSLKANPHPEVVRLLGSAGCGAEISSLAELNVALSVGISSHDCIYTGPGKTVEEIDYAAIRGVGAFSVESVVDSAHISAAYARLGTRARCLLRVNGAQPVGGAGMRMSGISSQFGIDLDTTPDALDKITNLPACDVVGLHRYELSNATDETALLAELNAGVKIAAHLRDHYQMPIQILDLGGGFAAPFAQPGSPPAYSNLRQSLRATLDQHFPTWPGRQPDVIIESGRYLAGNCGTLLTTVLDVKQSKGRTFVVLDAGINHLGGMSGLRRLLPLAARPVHDQADMQNQPIEMNLVGPLCTPADVLAVAATMPIPAPGDVVRIDNVGAYGPTASLLAFLSRPGPVEIAVTQGHVISADRLTTQRNPIEQE